MSRQSKQAGARPRFCPRCKHEGGGSLCPGCGESMLEQGFCPVCESYWRLPEGAPCPKHDIALLADRPREDPALSAGEGTEWVTVARYANPIEVEARRLRLEAEGIPTFLDGERMGANSLYNVATGGIKLQVPGPLVADARVLLAQSWAPPAVVDDLDDAWEDLAPKPGAEVSSIAWQVLLVSTLILAALFAFVVYLRP